MNARSFSFHFSDTSLDQISLRSRSVRPVRGAGLRRAVLPDVGVALRPMSHERSFSVLFFLLDAFGDLKAGLDPPRLDDLGRPSREARCEREEGGNPLLLTLIAAQL